MPTLRRIYQQGNSYVVSLPSWMLEQIEVTKGDTVILDVKPGKHIKIYRNRTYLFGVKEKDEEESA